MDLVSRIDGYEYASDLCCCPECQVPLRNIGCPDGNVVALLTSHGQECSCEVIYIVTELRVCSRIVEFCVSECILIREELADPVEHIRECEIYQGLLGPGIITCTSVICLQFCLLLRSVRFHIIRKLRDDDACRFEVLGPSVYPFQ